MKHPIRTDYNTYHWKFHRQLPHGTLPTRQFSVRPREPESAPWFSAVMVFVLCTYLLACFMDYMGWVVGK